MVQIENFPIFQFHASVLKRFSHEIGRSHFRKVDGLSGIMVAMTVVTYLEVTHDVTDCDTVKFVFDPNSSNRLKNSSSLGPMDSHNEQFDFFRFNFGVFINFDGWVGSAKNPRPKFFMLIANYSFW